MPLSDYLPNLGSVKTYAVQTCFARYAVQARLDVGDGDVLLESPVPTHPHRLRIRPHIVYRYGGGTVSNFDGTAVISCSHAGNVTLYNAAQGGAVVAWGSDVLAVSNAGTPLFVEGVTQGGARITLTLGATGNTPVHQATAAGDVDVVDFTLEITATDGTTPPKSVLLAADAKFRAALTGGSGGTTYLWSIRGDTRGLSYQGGSRKKKSREVRLATTYRSDIKNDRSVQVKTTSRGRSLVKTHDYTIVDPALRAADGGDPITSILVGQTREYKVVVTPSDSDLAGIAYEFADGGDPLDCEARVDAAEIVVVKGKAASDAGKVAAKTTLGGSSKTVELELDVVELATSPQIIPLLYTDAATCRFKVANTHEGDTHAYAWTASGKGSIEGTSTGESVKIKTDASGPGVAVAKLKYKPNGGDEISASGRVVFLRLGLTKIRTQSDNTWTTYTAGNGPGDRPFEVLLALSSDPAPWNVGRLDAFARREPENVMHGTYEHLGTTSWTPPRNGHVRAAGAQPDDHGEDEPQVRLLALPKARNLGPPADPGYTDETVEYAYKMNSYLPDTRTATARAEFNVRVHRFGCSSVRWRRRGGGVSWDDRIQQCTHHVDGGQHWHGQGPTWMAGTHGRLRGDRDITAPGGHQHGGRCHWCSGAAGEGVSACPRTVWHYVEPSATVLTRARLVANALRTFARGGTPAPNAAYNALLTAGARAHINRRKGRMLAVLLDSTGSYTYALSGAWDADGPWKPKIPGLDSRDTSRTFEGYSRSSVTYRNVRAPFNTAPFDSFGRTGRCAAPAVLYAAKLAGLHDIRMHEVWVSRTDDPNEGHFNHGHEIASCQYCRRILGAMLCEHGAR
ncbi:MAG: hypothetical protein ACRBN8_46030 [Nannocystales bacterium]